MGIALAANAPQLVNACKKTNAAFYQLYILAMLGGISLNPCIGRKHFTLDIDVSGHTIIDIFIENQYYYPQYNLHLQ